MKNQEEKGYFFAMLFEQNDCSFDGLSLELGCPSNITNSGEKNHLRDAGQEYSDDERRWLITNDSMIYFYENLAVVGNIELLNCVQLRETLGKIENSIFLDRHADNHILVIQAYLKWGASFVEHLDGNYSFAIINLDTRNLLAARDHIGTRPCYYWSGKKGIAISDSLGGLQRVVNNTLSPDNEFIADYLLSCFPQRNSTFFTDCKTLPPAHILIVSQGQCNTIEYWQINNNSSFMHIDDEHAMLCEIVRRSIAKRVHYKENIAVLLSGGLDSSSILALMADMLGKGVLSDNKLLAITRVFKEEFCDEKRDERKFAKDITERWSIPLYFCDDEIIEPLKYLEEYYEIMGNLPCNPFFAISDPLHKLSQALGMKTLVTGFGGDEIASMPGRNVFSLLFKRMQYIQLFYLLKRYAQVYSITFWQSVKLLVVGPLLPRMVLNIYHDIRNPGRRSEEDISFIHPDRRLEAEGKRRNSPGIYNSNTQNIGEEICRNIHNGIFQHMLEVNVFNTCKYGIEFIHPLLDKDIAMFIAHVKPIELVKNGWRRSLFRRAMIGVLPENIRWRKDKSPFSLPYEKYIQASKESISDLLASHNCEAWDYIDAKGLEIWLNRLCDAPRSLKNTDLMALKIGMAVNVALFIEHNAQKQKKLNSCRLL